MVIKRSVSFDDGQDLALEMLARWRGRSVSWLIREALSDYFELEAASLQREILGLMGPRPKLEEDGLRQLMGFALKAVVKPRRRRYPGTPLTVEES